MENEEYIVYLNKVRDLFLEDVNFKNIVQSINKGRSSFQINQRYLKKEFDNDWIEMIEEVLPSLDAIVRNPRRFITVEEDIIDVSLAKQVSVESVKHLAQHTQFISSVDRKKDTVTPSRILNTSKEESFEVYENRFIFTLIKKLNEFIQKRFDAIKKSIITNNHHEVKVMIDSTYLSKGNKVNLKLETSTDVPFNEDRFSEATDYIMVERIKKIKNIVKGFLNSSFAKEMRNSAPVRPPITRTNVIKKEPNFKKALILWEFIQSYEKTGYEARQVDETTKLPQDLNEQYQQLMFINDLIISNFTSLQDGNDSLEEITNKLKEQIVDEATNQVMETEDDFPMINLDLIEVRKVYHKTFGDKYHNSAEYRDITAAMDRVLTQQKINQVQKDEALKKKLMEKQKKEEARVRAQNLRERKLEEQRRMKEEQLAISLLKKEKQEKIKEEKRLALEKERENRERQRIHLQQLLEQQEMDSRIDDYRKELELKMAKELEKYKETVDNMNKVDLNNINVDFENEVAAMKRREVEKFKKSLDQKLSKLMKQKI